MSQISHGLPVGAQRTMLAAALALAVPVAHGFQIDTGNSDVKVRWDNTFKYSASFRVEGQSDKLLSDINADDGDRNFDKGLISNRADVLSELDVDAGNFGGRVSASAWYDTVYNSKNDNDSAATINQLSNSYNEFSDDTQKQHGRDAELLDAFVFGKFQVGDTNTTLRLGRHAQFWGESLFFGDNGVAGGMAPIDAIKALSVPGSQFKELVMPVQQLSGQIRLTPDVALGAYYQYKWDNTRLPATGSYFEQHEILGDGVDRLFTSPSTWFDRGSDIEARDSGQYGVQLRFKVGETDYGLYATHYHSKTPQVYFRNPGEFFYVYPEDIEHYGMSFSRSIGDVNWAGEVSVRHNAPLASDGQFDAAGTADGRDNPLYAVGRTAHAQLSWFAFLSPNSFMDDGTFIGEIAWNRVTSIEKNRGAINPNADRDAWNVRMIFEPVWYQVVTGLDLKAPIGLGYGIGNSMAGGGFLGDEVGDLSLGLKGTYLQAWDFGVNYTHYFGPEGLFSDADGHGSFKQSLADRDFVSFTVKRTF